MEITTTTRKLEAGKDRRLALNINILTVEIPCYALH